MAKETLIPSVLAVGRCLSTGVGFMSQCDWNDVSPSVGKLKPVEIVEQALRATISNRLGKKEAAGKKENDIAAANIQRGDFAFLSDESDTLSVHWTLVVTPIGSYLPACNKDGFEGRLKEMLAETEVANEIEHIAERYARNIANARWLWRNRVVSDDVTVYVRTLNGDFTEGDLMTFKSLNLPMAHFDDLSPDESRLAGLIANGLSGDRVIKIDVRGFARIGAGQEVYPSQDMVLDEKQKKGAKSRVLYSHKGRAALHAQKIGNAIRTIDTWAGQTEPSSIEAYGSVTSKGIACRAPITRKDFYSLFDAWVDEGKKPDADSVKYVLAMLVRGGVFGAAEKQA